MMHGFTNVKQFYGSFYEHLEMKACVLESGLRKESSCLEQNHSKTGRESDVVRTRNFFNKELTGNKYFTE